MNKEELRRKFSSEWQRHYSLEVLREKGFERRRCAKCGRWFWSLEERETCGDPACSGYSFIGSPVGEALSYPETWQRVRDYFSSTGHEVIAPYPVVARWRDDLYFTIASIACFQPYVVRGEVPPPANPLVIPQPCLRFTDVENVGLTGRHYTNFVMIGQHAFNTEETGLFYWKEEAIAHDLGFLRALGIPEEEVVFHEDVWVGGGNFGPSMEYFVRGLELGNCVFMQYEESPSGPRELRTKVIDMGAGLARLAWVSSGLPSSYPLVFGPAADSFLSEIGLRVDQRAFLEFSREAGVLNADERDVEAELRRLSEKYPVEEFRELFSAYASLDHLLTLLFAVRDGALPSNVGGGYNLRFLLRRVFAFEERYGWQVEWATLLESLARHQRPLFPDLLPVVETTAEVLSEERRKHRAWRKRAGARLIQLRKRMAEGWRPSPSEIRRLYESEGIHPEELRTEAEKLGISLEVPVLGSSSSAKPSPPRKFPEFPATEPLYYTDVQEFKARVLGIHGDWVVLDRTAFFPESGGQACDTGTLNGVRVLEVLKEAGTVFHRVAEPGKFSPGMEVVGRVDWERRLETTKHHTAAHLLMAAARRILGPHVWQAGARKEPTGAHMDLTHFRRISDEELRQMEDLVNAWIREDLPVEVVELLRTEAERRFGFRIYQGGAVPGRTLRIVRIGEVDAQACGGTHHVLASTGKIGVFLIKARESVADGVERIRFVVSKAALQEYRRVRQLLEEASRVLSVSSSELPASLSRIFSEWKAMRKEREKLASRLAEAVLEKGSGAYLISSEVLAVEIARKASKKPLTVAVFLPSGRFFVGSGEGKALEWAEKNVRGKFGGSPKFVSGKTDEIPREVQSLG